MVDGVHGVLDHVVKLVVVENRNILDCVMIPNLHVEGKNVKDQALMMLVAMNFAVQVRYEIYVALFVKSEDQSTKKQGAAFMIRLSLARDNNYLLLLANIYSS